ncbi:MAG: Xaa-Pro aminopeptidase [Hyphococcus sp.]|nr:MAG: Xaa-Pro aminopeptidase [Marinicaulis sp.]
MGGEMMKNQLVLAIAFTLLAGLAPSAAQDDERDELRSPRGTAPFSKEVYAARRAALMKTLGPGVAILEGASDVIEGKQDPDFAYLTGIVDEGGAALALFPGERAERREHLFLPSHTPETDIWTGERMAIGDAIRERTGFRNVSRRGRMNGMLPSMAARNPEFHYLGSLVGPNQPMPATLELMRKAAARVPGARVTNKSLAIANMRAKKEPRELELMQKAIDATIAGHLDAMAAVKPGMNEGELQQIIEDAFRREGANGIAFNSIVASGPNSTILHYIRNDRTIRDGDLVLVDIGSEYQHYASDITRTFPASGKFTARQREVYEAVLAAQEAAAAKLKAGALMREDVQAAAEAVLRERGFIDDFKHGIGHFVGLEVHDAGDYLEGLPEGAVVTIEPGVYLSEEGIGVRIEDEYLITRNGSRHLTGAAPRTPDAIEALMAE